MKTFSNILALASTGNLMVERLPYPKLGRWAALLPACLLVFNSFAQTGEAPVIRHSLELRSGYTGGSFSHYTNDYTSSLNIFGGSPPRTREVVEHQFNGVLFGASWRHETVRADRISPSFSVGMDVLSASDQLTFSNGRDVSLRLWAVHPRLGVDLKQGRWLLQTEGGVLVGRVGYFATEETGFLSRSTVVDTADAVFTIRARSSWNNGLLTEVGYGAGGLLGLANPTWHAGVGMGFGPLSPIAILAGITGAKSTNEGDDSSEQYFLQIEATPPNSRWRATSFFSVFGIGTGTYGRVAVQVAYRLPLGAAKTSAPKSAPK
ncbi:hypothetical protein IC235_09485 [Hymenobacter sp. BT664]|uniref:Uncharacterized protein n=1 Tax=Hymenobacter montanus TaxID=2771359 RepID=A0A927BCT9_9BACT|nr:hypothetical protein [Hymenobacter montanus]MBD2768121.1 hypothetical protein [Hymenobacter montanus]